MSVSSSNVPCFFKSHRWEGLAEKPMTDLMRNPALCGRSPAAGCGGGDTQVPRTSGSSELCRLRDGG